MQTRTTKPQPASPPHTVWSWSKSGTEQQGDKYFDATIVHFWNSSRGSTNQQYKYAYLTLTGMRRDTEEAQGTVLPCVGPQAVTLV